MYFQERLKSEGTLDLAKVLNEAQPANSSADPKATKSKGGTSQMMSQSGHQSKKDKSGGALQAKSPAKASQKTQVMTQQSNAKTQPQVRAEIMSKAELGETTLQHFIDFFNYVMKIQDFRSFLTACQNVCVIKKKKVDATIPDKAIDILEAVKRAANAEEAKHVEEVKEAPLPVNPRA